MGKQRLRATQCFSTKLRRCDRRAPTDLSAYSSVEGYSRIFSLNPDRESRLSYPLQLVAQSRFFETATNCDRDDVAAEIGFEAAVWCRTPVVRGTIFSG